MHCHCNNSWRRDQLPPPRRDLTSHPSAFSGPRPDGKLSVLAPRPEASTSCTCSGYFKASPQGWPPRSLFSTFTHPPAFSCFRNCQQRCYLDWGQWIHSYLMERPWPTPGIRAAQGWRKWKIKSSLNCGVPLSKLRDLKKCTPCVDTDSGVSHSSTQARVQPTLSQQESWIQGESPQTAPSAGLMLCLLSSALTVPGAMKHHRSRLWPLHN